MKRIAIMIIDGYRLLVGPALHTLVPIRSGCRFPITCSEYCRLSIQERGVARGISLGMRRLLSCHSFSRREH